jgi:hypothetical protein
MNDRTRLCLTIATAVVCGALSGLAAVGWLGRASTPAPSPPAYSSALGTSGPGCWVEIKADATIEALCGDLTRRMVSA